VRAHNPDCRVEVLIPDFNGDEDALDAVLDAEPDVLNHNTETIARLYKRVRPDANYRQTLTLLERAAARRDRERAGCSRRAASWWARARRSTKWSS
jgi:lipoic acid synthetase